MRAIVPTTAPTSLLPSLGVTVAFLKRQGPRNFSARPHAICLRYPRVTEAPAKRPKCPASVLRARHEPSRRLEILLAAGKGSVPELSRL
jgi:hypothetical protein